MVSAQCDGAPGPRLAGESGDPGEACDPASQHIGKTEATLALRPKVDRRIYFPWAVRGSLASDGCTDEQARPQMISTDSGFDMARRDAFIQATESVSGGGRLKFFRYMPKSCSGWLRPLQDSPTSGERQWQPEQEADELARPNQEERISGKFEAHIVSVHAPPGAPSSSSF